MNVNKSSVKKLGSTLLLTMLVLSFASLFLVMALMDQNHMPTEFNLGWIVLFTFAVLFPVMAAHIHTMWLDKRIGRISWWFWISNATLAGLFVYSCFRRDSEYTYSSEVETVSWFFACYVGGTLGALIVLGVIRRFVPSWIGYQKPESESFEKPKLSLKTLFFWLTSVGVLCGALVNQKQLMLVQRHELPLPAWPLLGAFNAGLFCLVVIPLVTLWLHKTKPFWLAGTILIVLSFLIPISLAAVITISTVYYGTESSEISLAFTTVALTASLIAVAWFAACRWAGLIRERDQTIERRGIWKLMAKLFGLIGNTLKYSGAAISAAVLIYLAGWCFVHFQGGPERDPQLVVDAIEKSIGGELAVGEDWIELVNRKHHLPKEKNLAVEFLRVSNPFRIPLHEDEVKRLEGISQLSLLHGSGYDLIIANYMSKLGVSQEEFFELPSLNVEEWFYERHENYRRSLLEKFPSLASFDDEYSRWDNDEIESDEPMEVLEFGQEPPPADPKPRSRELVLAEYFWDRTDITKAFLDFGVPWSKEDYPVGAAFVEAHQSQIQKFRALSHRDDFYSPLVRTHEREIDRLHDKLISDATFMLRLSGYHNIGNGNIEAAIEDCESLWRLRALSNKIGHEEDAYSLYGQHQVARLAEAIAFSGKADLEQLRRLLKVRLNQPGLELTFPADDSVRRASQKDEFLRSVFPRISSTRQEMFYMDGPVSSQYGRFPQLVDWQRFDSEFDRYFQQSLSLARLAAAGGISFKDFYEKIWDIVYVTFPSGRRTGKFVYYSVFGEELLAFIKGPGAKGQMLAEKASSILEIQGIYSVRTNRALGETAMALQVYQKLNGHYPKSLNDLVPSVLAEVKLDPFSQDEFVYQTDGSEFELYSVYRNGVDDQGSDGDLIFHLPYRDLVDYIETE